MATFANLRAAIVDKLDELDGINVYGWPTPNPQTPCIMLGIPEIDYLATMRTTTVSTTNDTGLCTSTIPLELLLPEKIGDQGWRAMDPILDGAGSQSVWAMFMNGDRTLGGIIDDMVIRNFRPRTVEEFAAVPYLGGSWTIEISVQRTT